ncbi:aldehyde dehydrogenase family protein [Pseudonocardia sp. KRD291]|uniref:aldehyde dehydrogenase family protein n=1 Tax=Pseudonocardia sp. KRD291 TaxID=2792007 RepID=UPI001C49FE7A|nr:aldehyde dehydrogenase family protein [Pseudonocardia sp. KRD291]MBW0101003.1 aldehyde dehydrogenase family protein [Pseudonocardia sp. KRD291]
MSAAVTTVDPRSGMSTSTDLHETDPADVAAACSAAAAASRELDAAGRGFRAGLLTTMADALEQRREDVVATADRETALGPDRLNGELTRTAYQLRLFADVLREGSYLEATIDHAGDTPMGPRPDLRRMLVPAGPVAVFGASNFPLAFSVPGGDTAAALAAGCAVVVKAHGSHPLTSALCGEILAGAAADAGAPAGTVAVVFGRGAGEALVGDPHVTAVSFTGGHAGASALKRLIAQRPDPIPFYGELGSVNPLLVTSIAAAERASDIGSGLVGSFTLGGGQFCTKPGLVLVPADAAGDAVIEAVRESLAEVAPPVLLNRGISDSYAKALAGLTRYDPIVGTTPDGQGFAARPAVLVTDRLDDALLDEVFGPLAVVVRYRPDELATLLRRLPGSLVASVHGGSSADAERDAAAAVLRERTGRLLFDGFPTGVAVSWAQHHGGPWPSTDSFHTSVGTTAIRRFLRPMAWQAAPEHVLPEELRDGTVSVPRRVDGALVLPS